MTDKHKETTDRINELRKLYDISEAEMLLIQQIAMVIRMTIDCSPELMVKLIKAYAAMVEVIQENMYAKDKDS